jgi:hypothetical protein
VCWKRLAPGGFRGDHGLVHGIEGAIHEDFYDLEAKTRDLPVVERIDIQLPEAILKENPQKQARLDLTRRFAPTDRAPVVVDMPLFALLAGWGGTFGQMLRSPRDHLRGLILNQKYRYEHIRDDLPIDTKRLVVELDFGALRGVEFPMQVIFHGDNHPKTLHLLTHPEQIDGLEIPDPYSGHNRMRIDWSLAMRQAADDFDVRLNGERLPVEIALTHPGGSVPSAFALCGANLFLWMMTEPERVRQLMEIVTRSHINCLAYTRGLDGGVQSGEFCLGADAAEMLSVRHFKTFVVPYYLQIWQQYPGQRNFHMCGKIDHLLESLHADLQIDALDGFGFPVDPERLAKHLAGRVVLRGGPHPLIIHDGPPARILAEAEHYLHSTGRCGGYILSEGFGIMPGTPPEHIDALVEASRRAGPPRQQEC